MSHHYRPAFLLPLQVVLSLAGSPLLFAGAPPADTTWNGSSDSLWATVANWDNSLLPSSLTGAVFPSVIPATGSTITLVDGMAAKSLTLDGAYTLSGGSISLTDGAINVNNAAAVTVGSKLTGSSPLYKDGNGSLTLEGTHDYTGGTYVFSGSLTVPASASITATSDLWVENTGSALNISGGGTVTTAGASLGAGVTATGNTLSVSGSGSALSVTSTLNVGIGGDNNALNISSNGAVTAASVWIAGEAGADGNAVTVTGSGTTLATTTGSLITGYAGTNSVFTITGGAAVTSNQAITGFEATAGANEVNLTGTGSTWNNPGAYILGYNGSDNYLTISGGGALNVTTQDTQIGFQAASSGNTAEVNGTGSTLSTSNTLYVGNYGSGNLLTALNAGSVSSGNVRIGSKAGSDSNSAVIGSGATWSIGGTIRVGDKGDSNLLSISGGAAVTSQGNAFVGYDGGADGNAVIISGTGSKWSVNASGKELVISNGLGTGNTVTVENGGTLEASVIKLGPYGKLQIGDNSAAGTVSSGATISGPSGGGTVSFAHTDASYTFSSSLTGSLSLLHEGSGTTTLTGTTTYTGSTTVSAGTLVLSGAGNPITASPTITVAPGATLDVSGITGGFTLASGQTLQGSGSYTGDLYVQNGATVSPGNSPGTLPVTGDVVWASPGNYNWQITSATGTAGTDWDLITATGALDLSALSLASQFSINLWTLASTGPDVNGAMLNFDTAQSYTWTLVSAQGGITGFDASGFAINTAAFNGTGGFANPFTGTFSITTAGNDLNLVYTGAPAVPEPAHLFGLAALLGSSMLRRSRRRIPD